MSSYTIIYFLLQSFLYISLSWYGYRIYKSDKFKKKYILLILITFSLIEGLRFGRGTDYNIYYSIYYNATISDGIPIMFYFLCSLFRSLGLPYQVLIYACSLMLICSGTFFLCQHKRQLIFSLPLFVYYTLLAENLIRWYLGFSFILIGLTFFYEKRKYIPGCIFFIIGFLFHYALIIIIPIIAILCMYKKRIMPPTISIIIYLLILVFSQYNNSLSSLLEVFSFVAKRYSSDIYYYDSRYWIRDNVTYNYLSVTIRDSIIFIWAIIEGYKLSSTNNRLIPYYNLCLLGIICYPLFYKVELFYRFDMLLLFFLTIIISYGWTRGKKGGGLSLMNLVASTLILYYIFRTTIVTDPLINQYIWDAHGRDFIPLEYFYDRK